MNNEYMETIKDNETNYKANLLKIKNQEDFSYF